MSFWNSLACQQLPEARQEPTHTTQVSSPLKMTLPYSHKANCHWPIFTCSCPILWSVVWGFFWRVVVRVVVGFGFFSFKYQVVLGVIWKYTGSTDCISTKKKTEHLTKTLLHFNGLVSSLTLGFSISGYRVFVDCPSKKHPEMLLVLIIPPINLFWRFLPSNTEYHRLVQSIIFNFKTGTA